MMPLLIWALLLKKLYNVSYSTKYVAINDFLKDCVGNGWQYDSSTKLFAPKPVKAAKFEPTGINQLQQLTDYFVYLESS
jgi:hypothetical protein